MQNCWQTLANYCIFLEFAINTICQSFPMFAKDDFPPPPPPLPFSEVGYILICKQSPIKGK